ncbi:MAG: HlyD family secretion protein, partial [Prevotella sp.]|nr:HlyD family secretion protein [Prevotella sp.]
MKRKDLIFVSLFLLALSFNACGSKEKEYDATGTFEATETTVYAEQGGALLTFIVQEGEEVAQGQEVGIVDTTQIWLKIRQLGATKEVYASQKPDMQKQIAATRQQLAKA